MHANPLPRSLQKVMVKYATGFEGARKVLKMMVKIGLLQEIPSNYDLANREEKKDEILAMCPGFAWITKCHPLDNYHVSHVIRTTPAAAVIKTYSPNLMVRLLLRETANPSPSKAPEIARTIAAVIPNLHSLVIGLGLGRNPLLQATVACITKAAREANLPLVLDSDGR
ncbi:hypothetical protein MMC31_008196 [Peltigera leucophlebia]|nr:hypothetical protein [Peltigera leucophlebia]